MEKKEYDLDELLGGNVDSITEKFGDLSDEQLTQLAKLEGGAGKRATLLKAIEGEQGSRKLTARTQELQAAAAKEGVTLHSDADIEARVADELAVRQAEQDLGRNSADDERDGKIAALEQQVDQLNKDLAAARKARTPAKAKAPAAPRRLSLSGNGKLDPEGGFTVAFTGSDDMTVQGLPELEFDGSAFERQGGTGSLLLTQSIEFPESAAPTEVCKVWLLDRGGSAVAATELISPLPIGGSKSRIPEKYLRFDVPGQNEADALAA